MHCNTDMLASLLQDCASKGGFIGAGHNLCHPKAYESSSPFLHHQTICCFLIPKVDQLKLLLTA